MQTFSLICANLFLLLSCNVCLCLDLRHDTALEWQLIYAADPADESKDQELECVLVGPVTLGTNKFVFEAPAPDASAISGSDLLGMTIVFLKGLYRDEEFVRVGYYVNAGFPDGALPVDEEGRPVLPTVIDPAALTRTIVNEPRVTRRLIRWDASAEEALAAEAAAAAAAAGAGAGEAGAAGGVAMDDDVLDLSQLPEVGEGDGDDDEEEEEGEEETGDMEIDVPAEVQY